MSSADLRGCCRGGECDLQRVSAGLGDGLQRRPRLPQVREDGDELGRGQVHRSIDIYISSAYYLSIQRLLRGSVWRPPGGGSGRGPDGLHRDLAPRPRGRVWGPAMVGRSLRRGDRSVDIYHWYLSLILILAHCPCWKLKVVSHFKKITGGHCRGQVGVEQRPGGGGQLRVGGAALQRRGQQLPLLPPGVRLLRPRLQQPVHALPHLSGRGLHSFINRKISRENHVLINQYFVIK